MKIGLSTIVLLLSVYTAASAQQSPAEPEFPEVERDAQNDLSVPEIIRNLDTVEPEKLRGGLSSTRLMGKDVFGADGQQIGEIQDLQFQLPGTLQSIVIETGGILGGALDVGDSTFQLPWNTVDLSGGFDDIRVSITEDMAERLGLLERPEEKMVKTNEFLASELVRGNVYVPEADIYAVVDDIIFDPDGQIIAILADRRSLIHVTKHNLPFKEMPMGLPPGSLDVPLSLEAVDIAATLLEPPTQNPPETE